MAVQAFGDLQSAHQPLADLSGAIEQLRSLVQVTGGKQSGPHEDFGGAEAAQLESLGHCGQERQVRSFVGPSLGHDERRAQEKQLSLAEIAERLGYGSEAAFSRAFKRHHGRAPGSYRQGGLPFANDAA